MIKQSDDFCERKQIWFANRVRLEKTYCAKEMNKTSTKLYKMAEFCG